MQVFVAVFLFERDTGFLCLFSSRNIICMVGVFSVGVDCVDISLYSSITTCYFRIFHLRRFLTFRKKSIFFGGNKFQVTNGHVYVLLIF